MAAVRICPETVDAILVHCVADYPSECCGLVLSDPVGKQVPRRCRNIQDELHEKDPDAHPRTSRNAYRMDDREVMAIVQTAEDAGARLWAIYHSHIDCEAYFSDEDKAAALFLDEPAYPEALYLVVSVREGRVSGQTAYQYDEAARTYIRVPLIVEA